jgi:hypothetical protein
VDPAGQKFFIGKCPREKERLSDYDHSITKSFKKKGARRSTIPQFGEQSQQLIPPLQVLSKENEAMADFVVESKLTKAQLREEDHILINPGGGRNQFVFSEPLM